MKQHILVAHPCDDEFCITSYMETQNALGKKSILHTTQLNFLSFAYAERLFVYINGELHEITLGKCEGTNREIREAHNIGKMLISGEFDWFR